jgi:hypothetical protein
MNCLLSVSLEVRKMFFEQNLLKRCELNAETRFWARKYVFSADKLLTGRYKLLVSCLFAAYLFFIS